MPAVPGSSRPTAAAARNSGKPLPSVSGIFTTSGSRPSASAEASSLPATASMITVLAAWRARDASVTCTGTGAATLTGTGLVPMAASSSGLMGTATFWSR